MERSTLAGAVSVTGLGGRRPTEPAAAAPADPVWFDRPMRWAQLTLVENDPGRFDPAFWLDYFRRTHSDAACLSAGGVVAYYPTMIPFHHRSLWLGDSDPFGDLLGGCRRMGMVVLARTDSHAVHQDAREAHPEWIAVDRDGEKRKHWASPEMWVTCALGPYNFEFMTEVHREIMTNYRVDGIFTNRWDGSGMCYCEPCRTHFREFCGMDLPLTDDPLDPARRNYIVWRQERLFELWRLWDRTIREINPSARYIANAGGGAMSTLDMKTIGELADILFADRQARRGLMPPWANGKNGKEYRATLGRKPIGGIFSVGVEEPYRWKDSVQSEPEIRIWVADGVANGLRPWFTKFSGTLYDRRWLKVVEDIYGWHHRNEKYLRNREPFARVAIVYSQQSATFYGGSRARAKVEEHTLGMYQALIEARMPFEMVHDRLLGSPDVDRFKLLIFPNIAALSNNQCREIRDFCRRGGSLLATHETSLYDEWGHRRENFGLSDLFGVSYAGRLEGPMRNSYLQIEPNPATGRYHPVVSGLEEATRIINGVNRVEVTADKAFEESPLTLIPTYPDLPMEKVFPRHEQAGPSQLYLRQEGDSRIAYFPWDVDRTFWEVLCVDHGRLLRNAVDWALGEKRSIVVSGAGLVEVTAWLQADAVVVHLVNLTNPMTMKGPYRELLPVGEQEVQIDLPPGRKARRARLLVKQLEAPFEAAGDSAIRLNVPSILDHEVIAVDL